MLKRKNGISSPHRSPVAIEQNGSEQRGCCRADSREQGLACCPSHYAPAANPVAQQQSNELADGATFSVGGRRACGRRRWSDKTCKSRTHLRVGQSRG